MSKTSRRTIIPINIYCKKNWQRLLTTITYSITSANLSKILYTIPTGLSRTFYNFLQFCRNNNNLRRTMMIDERMLALLIVVVVELAMIIFITSNIFNELRGL